MQTLKGDVRQPAAEPEITFTTRDEIFYSGLQPFDKARLLEKWDREHPPRETEREKILGSGMSAYDAAQALAKLPPEQPARPRLLLAEREALAEAKINLEKRQAAYVELVGKVERYRQAKEQTGRDLKKLESEVTPDDVEAIRSMIYMRGRMEVIVNRIGDLPDKIRALENSTNAIIGSVYQLFTRKFGASREAGGPSWSNPGFAALPTRISGCCAAIETELNRK
jgi:hypothetical protein